MKLAELLEEDVYSMMSAHQIYTAEFNLKEFGLDKFDYDRALDELIKKDKKGNYIYNAGLYWKEFDNEKGLKALEKTDYIYSAKRRWPKGIKEVDALTKKIKEKATKFKSKSLKLK